MQHDNYAFWQAAMAGASIEITKDVVTLGCFRERNNTPVSVWVHEGQVMCLRGTRTKHHYLKPDTIMGRAEYGGFGAPVPHDDYTKAFETGVWPDESSALLGDNAPPEPDSLEAIQEQIDEVSAKAAKLLKAPISTQQEADQAANLRDRIIALGKKAEALRVAEKEPHLKASRDVDAKWKPLTERADTGNKKLRDHLTPWLKKLQQEAAEKAAREAAERAAAEAAANPQAPPAPAEDLPLAEPKVYAGQAGARTGLRSIRSARITDLKAFAAFLAETNNPDLVALAQKLANRIVANRATAPGIETVEDKVAA